MSDDEPTTSGGLSAHRKTSAGEHPFRWTQGGFARPATTPGMREALKGEAAEIREEEPDISHAELARRLALRHGLRAATIRTYI